MRKQRTCKTIILYKCSVIQNYTVYNFLLPLDDDGNGCSSEWQMTINNPYIIEKYTSCLWAWLHDCIIVFINEFVLSIVTWSYLPQY